MPQANSLKLSYSGLKHGFGKISFEDGSWYEGGWVDGDRKGSGTFWTKFEDIDEEIEVNQKNPDQPEIYSGEWDDNKRNGFGEQVYHDGTIYTGNWYENRKHGKGQEKSVNGSVYSGDWVSGDKEGSGRYVNEVGDEYNGDYKADKRNGYCTVFERRPLKMTKTIIKWRGF